MISQHARLARTLAEQLGLPDTVREAVGAAYEQWDGRGWPGDLKADAVPIAAQDRPARRVHGGGAPGRRDRRRRPRWPAGGRAGSSIRPWRSCCAPGPSEIFGGLDAVPAWQAVIAAEPALAVALSAERARQRAGRHRELRGPEVAVHPRPFGRGRRAGRGSRPQARAAAGGSADAAPGRAGARLRAAGRVELDLGPARAR